MILDFFRRNSDERDVSGSSLHVASCVKSTACLFFFVRGHRPGKASTAQYKSDPHMHGTGRASKHGQRRIVYIAFGLLDRSVSLHE